MPRVTIQGASALCVPRLVAPCGPPQSLALAVSLTLGLSCLYCLLPLFQAPSWISSFGGLTQSWLLRCSNRRRPGTSVWFCFTLMLSSVTKMLWGRTISMLGASKTCSPWNRLLGDSSRHLLVDEKLTSMPCKIFAFAHTVVGSRLRKGCGDPSVWQGLCLSVCFIMWVGDHLAMRRRHRLC